MMKLALGTLPDDLIHWSGSADDLATKANELLPSLTGSADESVNERLVRYYVQEGALNPPDREGREAIFRFRQLIQLIVARLLLRDNWPLRKVAELIREADVDALLALAPGSKPRTRAEEAIAGFRRGSPDARLSMTPRAASLGIPDFHQHGPRARSAPATTTSRASSSARSTSRPASASAAPRSPTTCAPSATPKERSSAGARCA